jgi:Fe-S-cluster containining protein
MKECQFMVIEPDRYQFSKIECRDCDILLPFICRRTGSCCSVYVPRFSFHDLEIIERDLNLQSNNFFSEYQSCYLKRITGHSVRCPLLEGSNHCLIYQHPLQPQVCRLFPFSYGGEVITSCPAHVEHRRLLDCLVEGERECMVYDSSFCPILELRPIREDRWCEILARFQSTPSLPAMSVAFFAFNEPTLTGEGMAMHRSWKKM